MKICEKIIRRGLSVREAEQLVKPHSVIRRRREIKDTDPHMRALGEELQQLLGTRVRLQHGKKRGTLIIEYYSTQDLERIINIIKTKR
jgi:ParB family chromosome partitioning protein